MKRLLLAGGVAALVLGSMATWPTLHEADAAETPTAGATAKHTVRFNRDIRPILTDNCFACHGPDAATLKGGLRLDGRETALGAAKSGKAAIVPGHPERSELIARINHPDPAKRMPEAHSGKTLTEEQKALLARWIAEGAEYEKHWSLITPVRPATPQVAHAAWVRNPIDAFVAARLAEEGLNPSSEADRRVLIRRVTFDLIGLPPTPEEVEAFVNDTSADAYEKVVDRLLASAKFGEHRARFWLDAARYGDTHGLHLDNYREMWPYRDAVIGAFNANMPWDQFVLKNMAGDLVADSSLNDKVLSGFNRAHVTTNEGGSIAEEVHVRNVIDRASTFGTVFLGLTTGCAVCHDHKFDPISQKEFFQLYAFFNNVDMNPMDGNAKEHAPVVRVPTPEQEQKLAELEATLADVRSKVADTLSTVQYEEPKLPQADRREVVWVQDDLPADVRKHVANQNVDWVWAGAADHPVHEGERSVVLKATGLQQIVFDEAAKGLRVGYGDKLIAHVYIDPANPPKQIMIQWHTTGWKHRAYWGEDHIPYGKAGTTERRRIGDLPEAGKWVRLEVDASDVGIGPADVITGLAFTQQDGTAYWDAAGALTAASQDPVDFVWIDDETPEGAQLAGDGQRWQWVAAEDGKHPVHSGQRALRRAQGDKLNQDYFTGAKPLMLHAGDVLFAHVYIDPSDPAKSVQLQFNNGSWDHRARWGSEAHGPGRQNGADHVVSEQAPEPGKWVRLEVPIEQVGLKAGDALNGWAFTQVGGTVYWDAAGIKTLQPPDDRHLHSLAIWTERAKADQTLPKDIQQAAAGAPDGRTPAQEKVLRDYYLQWVYAATRNQFDPLNAQIAQAEKERDAVEKAMPTTLVMKERANPKPAFLLKRGEYDKKDEELGPLTRAVPAALPQLPQGAPVDRLGLAQWLVMPENPLMARVTVNRFWLQFFGSGLVETAEDFGSQGTYPSHPDLLDWLAVDFRESGWDVKRLMKMIVTSATYRQSSKSSPQLQQRDPKNRLLARGPRYRLDAEMLRDQALAVSGLLVETMGGPGVRPPQPAGLWEAVGYSGSNTVRFKADTEPEKVHRRTLYTFFKRTAPPPQQSTFDAPPRESCVVRRERTNTPLQALLLMNDPQYVEAARSLAQHAMKAAPDAPGRVNAMVMRCLGRPATEAESAVLIEALSGHAEAFASEPGEAKKLIAIGAIPPDAALDPVELAAWTMTANTILNWDEVVTKN